MKKVQLPDYRVYHYRPMEILFYGAQGVGIIALLAYVFYRSPIAILLLLPAIYPFLLYRKKSIIQKRKEELTLQFREMMNSVIAGLQAGYSIENAFLHAREDLVLLYGTEALIVTELTLLSKELRNNISLESILAGLSKRCEITDISEFAEVFTIAKRSGGNLPGILKNTADLIADKIEVRREIMTMISAKKMEQNIMNVVPFGIILYIDATSPGFFDCLYHNLFGVILMSVLLILYLIAYLLADRILSIQ